MLLYRRRGPVLDAYVEKYANLAGVTKPKEASEKKWGCCTPKNGIIKCTGAACPEKLPSTWSYEIVHLRWPDHQKTYWKEVERLMPKYREVEKLENSTGGSGSFDFWKLLLLS